MFLRKTQMPGRQGKKWRRAFDRRETKIKFLNIVAHIKWTSYVLGHKNEVTQKNSFTVTLEISRSYPSKNILTEPDLALNNR